MTRIEIDRLVRRVDRVAVIDGATIAIDAADLTVLLGPSGSGKTMLARLIAGLERPDSGEIDFDGRSVLDVPPADRRVGYVPREETLWPQLSVARNVGYGPRARGMSRAEVRTRVADALGMVGIDSLADRATATLTGPQRRRAAIARALAVEPSVLILDDPIAGVDPRSRPEFWADLRRIQAEARVTLICLTDDPREALMLADRIGVMDLGRVVQVGAPEQVYGRPVDAFVARLFGSTNVIQGHAESVDARGSAVVKTPIGRLIGRAGPEPIAPGAPVTLLIRPESIAIGGVIPPGSNRFPATIAGQAFLGELRRLDLRGPNDWPVVALAMAGTSGGLKDGQSITASIPPDSIVVLASRLAAADGPG